MRIALLIGALALALPAAGPAWPELSPATTAVEEICRIRIVNKPKGLIQVSADSGRTYSTVGRVKVIANARIHGYAAASYTPRGTVAAIAIHGLRIKTGQAALGIGKAQQPLMFSVTPVEFAVIPRLYGGHQPRSSQIITDIHAGHSIFRNQAPYVGNPVFIERDGKLIDMPEDYTPVGGETFIIVVEKPKTLPKEIVFENRVGGAVTVKWPDDRTEELTTVVRPVKGIGRYDGTTFTGTGSINTNHGGVITIGTSPLCPPGTKEGGKVETRGGFMIQPSYHVKEQDETAPQVMVIGPKNPSKPCLEGTSPLFEGYIGLTRYPSHPENSYRVEARTGDGDWGPLPAIAGKADVALAGVSEVRLVFPEYAPKLLAEDLAKEAADYTRAASRAGARAFKGVISLKPKRVFRAASAVYFYVDGNMASVSNQSPYTYAWDTTKVPNGLHEIIVKATLESGETFGESREIMIVN